MLVSPPTRPWTSSLQLERGKGARSSRCSSLETMPVGFRSLKKGSHPCSQSRPHCLPARAGYGWGRRTVLRLSGERGSGSQTRRKAWGARPLQSQGVTWKGDPSRGGASHWKRLPLPRFVAITSCFSSSPTPVLSTAAAVFSQGVRVAGTGVPLPPMCPCARAQWHRPAPWSNSGGRWRWLGYLLRMLYLSGRGTRAGKVSPTVRGVLFFTH